MSERERPLPSERLLGPLPKVHDAPYAYRGTWDAEPEGVCRLRIFAQEGRTPVMVCSELPENPSTSITNLAEILAAELIACYLPHRFEEMEPVVWLEHYPAEPDPRGRAARRPTWDRVSFSSWRTPRQNMVDTRGSHRCPMKAMDSSALAR